MAEADAQHSQRQRQRVGARGHADRLLGLAVGGEVPLERLVTVTERERAFGGDVADLGQQFLEQRGVVSIQADEGDRHLGGGPKRVCRRHAAALRIAVDGAD